jgi:hypothetical protein
MPEMTKLIHFIFDVITGAHGGMDSSALAITLLLLAKILTLSKF